jgi:hypothetical protein
MTGELNKASGLPDILLLIQEGEGTGRGARSHFYCNALDQGLVRRIERFFVPGFLVNH